LHPVTRSDNTDRNTNKQRRITNLPDIISLFGEL
jgi:hypothetical protein